MMGLPRGVVVRVIERWQADSFDVFVMDRSGEYDGTLLTHIYRHVKGGEWTREEAGDPEPFTGQVAPSFTVPREVMEALVAEARRASPSLDRDDAVKDARATRDRLLAIVEHKMTGGKT